MREIFLLVFVGLFLVSCLKNEFDTNQLITENDVTYLDPSQRKDEFPNDPYRIVGVTPAGSTWHIIVEYTGGCEEHQFFTHWDGHSSSTNVAPSNISFTLLHNSKGDACERLVRDTLDLDMVEIFNADPSGDTLYISVVNGYTGVAVEVDPFLSQIGQGSTCKLDASLLGTTCNNGFWQNQWLLLSDTIGIHEKVWVQPVRAQETQLPATGKYKIGVRLLFGFRFSQVDCNDLPDGKIVPAAITCIVPAD